jgi:hypothetical protein
MAEGEDEEAMHRGSIPGLEMLLQEEEDDGEGEARIVAPWALMGTGSTPCRLLGMGARKRS